MSSNERETLIGRRQLLEESRETIIIKIKGIADLIREHSSTLLIDNFEEMDDKAIKVYADELAKLIRELRNNGVKLKEMNKALGVKE